MTFDEAFRPRAIDDVNRQVLWFSKQSPDLAWKFLEAVKRTVEEIIKNPDGGTVWDGADVDEQMQFVRYRKVDGFWKHLVIYSATPDGVRIVRVLHSAQRITTSMLLDD